MKSPGLNGFTDKFHQTFKDWMIILHKLFQKIEEDARLFNLLSDADITLYQNQTKTLQENYRQCSVWIYMQKSSAKYWQTWIQQYN